MGEGKAGWWQKCGGLKNRQPTTLQFFMKTKTKNKSEAKSGKAGHKTHRKGQKMRKTSMNSVSKIGFRVHDVGIGCLKSLNQAGKFTEEHIYPFVGEKVHSATRLRVVEIASYESSKYEKKKGGRGKNGSRAGTGNNT